MAKDLTIDIDTVAKTVTITGLMDGVDYDDTDSLELFAMLATKAGFTVAAADGTRAALTPYSSGTAAKRLIVDEFIHSV